MHRFILILVLLVSSNVNATPKALALQPYFSAVLVKDMERSISWYQKILGFELVNQTDLMAKRGFHQANLKRNHGPQSSDTIWLELIQTNKTLAPEAILANKPKKSKIAGYFKVGFEVAQLDLWVAWLKQSKVKFHGSVVKDSNTGKRTVLFLDPDGNRIQLFGQ